MNEDYSGVPFRKKERVTPLTENIQDSIELLVWFAMSYRSVESKSLGWIDCFAN